MNITYREIEGTSPGYYVLLAVLGLFIFTGLGAAMYMEHEGHYVSGMNNHVVWGMPHVFAVFLIVAASGALNVASIASVFGKTPYKPLAPLSALLAMSLLLGGLIILVLDLGRPERLIVAMLNYNFKSIFAWNIFLYTGFLAITAVYLWLMMERRMNPYSKSAGLVAFVWRLLLTTGTGSIFGFLVAREMYDSALLAPMFIIMSLAFGTAIYLLVLLSAYHGTGRVLGDATLQRLKNLLGVFIAAVLLMVLTFHLTKLYATQHHGVEQFILLNGGVYTVLFWAVQIGLGSLLPLVLLFHPATSTSRRAIVAASVLVVLGGLAQMYVLIIGGQAYPMELFPGFEVQSSFADGVVAAYTPSWYEIALGLGGTALALAVVAIAIKVLRFLPLSLADADVDPPPAAPKAVT